MNRTYKVTAKYANREKIKKIYSLSFQYKLYFNILTRQQLSLFYKNEGYIPKYLPLLDISNLSERQKQTCGSQVKSNLISYIGNTEQYIREKINNSSLSDKEKLFLNYINKYNLWFKKEIKTKGEIIPEYYLKLARKLFKHCKPRKPTMKNTTMILDKKVAILEKSNNSFDYWIKLSTLDKGYPSYLPIKSYDYLNVQEGKFKNVIQIIVKPDSIEYGLVHDTKPNPLEKLCKEISIDLGLVHLITTSTGNKYGYELFKLLKKYDKIIQDKVKGRMRDGLYKNSGELVRLYNKVRNMVKNEIGRILNKFLRKERPEVLVMENLDNLVKNTRRDGRLSRSMRRLLINSGFSKIAKRIGQKSERYRFEIDGQNPAYTSQECRRCHYVDSRNRNGRKFKCKNCGFTCDADFNGAVNVGIRRSDPLIGIYTPFKRVKEILRERFSSHEAVYSAARS